MNLMNREKGTITAEQREDKGDVNHSASQTLHQNTVQAMSNLLNANIDTGLMYAIGKERETWHTAVFKGTLSSISTMIIRIEKKQICIRKFFFGRFTFRTKKVSETKTIRNF